MLFQCSQHEQFYSCIVCCFRYFAHTLFVSPLIITQAETLRCVRVTFVAMEKQEVVNMSLCLCSCLKLSGMQIVSFLCVVILSSMVCLALPYSSTLSHKWHDLKIQKFSNIKCVVISSAMFLTFLILRIIL
jgi:hypothetical protein